MKLLILALIILGGWAWFSGYRIHPENFHYYVKVDVSSAQQELKLTDGSSVKGTIEEDAADYIKLNSGGLIESYRKTQIESMKSVAAPDFLTLMKENYELEYLGQRLVEDWYAGCIKQRVGFYELYKVLPKNPANIIP